MALATLAVTIVIATLVATYAAITHGLAKSDQPGQPQRLGPAAVLQEEETRVHSKAPRG
jgi:hypothetical protein